MPNVKFSEIEKFYIEANASLMSAQKIADKMRKAVTEEAVQSYVDGMEPERVTSGDLMAREPEKGFAVMTQNASELADEADKKPSQETLDKQNEEHIHKINP